MRSNTVAPVPGKINYSHDIAKVSTFSTGPRTLSDCESWIQQYLAYQVIELSNVVCNLPASCWQKSETKSTQTQCWSAAVHVVCQLLAWTLLEFIDSIDCIQRQLIVWRSVKLWMWGDFSSECILCSSIHSYRYWIFRSTPCSNNGTMQV